MDRDSQRAIAHGYLRERTASVRSAARFFRKITVERNYAGEHVLFRDQRVTAFLDITDPTHPRFNPEFEVDEQLAAIPEAARVHVIVVPNTPREHIASSLGGTIGLGDLRETAAVVESAERLAATLNIRNPRVYINSESNIGVGYLHVHIVGERTAQTRYPAPLAP